MDLLCVAREFTIRAMHGSMDGGVFIMRLFKQLCSIAVVFMFLCSTAMATEVFDTNVTDNDSAPTHDEEQPPTSNIDTESGVNNDSSGESVTPTETVPQPEPYETNNLDDQDDQDDSGEDEYIYDELGIYKVTLPTTGTLDFVIDPLGLAGLAEGESASLDDLDSGRIYPKSEIPAIVLNESSMPIKLTIELIAESKIENENNDDSDDDEDTVHFIEPNRNFVRTKSAVFEGDALNVLLYAVPSKHGISSLHDEFEPSDLGFVITEEGVELMFLLPAAEYAQADEYSDHRLVQGTGSGTQIRIGGYVNDTSNWSSYTDDYHGLTEGSISLNAVFTLIKIYDSEFEDSTQPVDGVMHLRTPNGVGIQSSTIILDKESLDALIPHDQVSDVSDIPVRSSQKRKRENL